MSLKYHSNHWQPDPSEHFGSVPDFTPNNDNNPPRDLLCDYPILARHWFGLDQEAV